MARPRKPWYRPNRDTWYVVIDGTQTPLARGRHNREAAEREFHRLMAERPEPEAPAARGTIGELVNDFLGWTERHKSPSTFRQRRHFLRSFIAFGRVRDTLPHRLTIAVVEDWLDEHPTWKASRRHAILWVVRLFNWAVKRRLIARNPISGIELPPQTRVLAYLTQEQRKAVFQATKDTAFQLFLTALEQTGCRPGELCELTAEHVDLEQGIWVLPKHKTAKRTGKPRVVYLTAGMLELTRRLVEERPEGPLLLNSRRTPWNRNAVRCRFRKLRQQFPSFGHFTATSYRRAYVTDALERGVDAVKVAELVGHTSTDIVMRHYSQLQERVRYMRDVAQQVVS
jgi:integrase